MEHVSAYEGEENGLNTKFQIEKFNGCISKLRTSPNNRKEKGEQK